MRCQLRRNSKTPFLVQQLTLRPYTRTPYPVLHCERLVTKYGMAVRVTLREEADDNVFMVFLPRHDGFTITDEDMAAINNHTIQYYLTYKRKSATTNRPMLQMDV